MGRPASTSTRRRSAPAWGTLFRIVGNPETWSWTDAVLELQAAADTGDDATAAGLQGAINTEIEAARQQIAYAAGSATPT